MSQRPKFSTSRQGLRWLAVAALAAASLVATAGPSSADPCSPGQQSGGGGLTLTFDSVGTCSWQVPAGVTAVIIDVFGAEGGSQEFFTGGAGGEARATLAVTPGQVLQLSVGGTGGDVPGQLQPPGAGGFNGGAGGGTSGNRGGSGGGGASDVRWGACAATLTCGFADRVVIGGGGGGAGGGDQSGNNPGGAGGGSAGATGGNAGGFFVRAPAQGGGGGTQTQGGSGGDEDCSARFNCFPGTQPQNPGAGGTTGLGGAGGNGGNGGGGGGGGGYYGGGGGGAGFRGGGGGGGSGFVASVAGVSDGSFPGGTRLGNGEITIFYDTTAPAVTVNQASGQADPTGTSLILFTAVFDEPVSGFATGDVTVGGSAGATSATVAESAPSDGTTYTLSVSGMTGSGTVTASVGGGVATDAFGNGNAASTSTDNTVTYDATGPTVTVNQAGGQTDPTSTSPVSFSAVFSEPATGFATGDVTVGGTAGATTATVTETAPGDGTTFMLAVSGMTGSGTVTASVGAGVATDGLGNPNSASTSTDNTVTFSTTGPTVTVNQASGQADPTGSSPILFRAVFSDRVTGFTNSDVTIGGAAGATTAVVTQVSPNNGTTYSIAISGMTGSGTVTVSIPAGAAVNAAGIPSLASTSTDNTVTFSAAQAPEAVCAGSPPPGAIVGTAGADNLRGTAGADVIFGLGGADVIDGRAGDDVICGGEGADSLAGGDGADSLVGGTENDVIDGGRGNDVQFGGAGSDVIDGGNDNDTMTGGSENDDFRGGAGTDTVTDFTPSAGDVKDRRVENF